VLQVLPSISKIMIPV